VSKFWFSKNSHCPCQSVTKKKGAQRIRQQMQCLPQTWPTQLDYTTSHHTSPFYHWSFQIGRLTDHTTDYLTQSSSSQDTLTLIHWSVLWFPIHNICMYIRKRKPVFHSQDNKTRTSTRSLVPLLLPLLLCSMNRISHQTQRKSRRQRLAPNYRVFPSISPSTLLKIVLSYSSLTTLSLFSDLY
jgi:hypothetical protein